MNDLNGSGGYILALDSLGDFIWVNVFVQGGIDECYNHGLHITSNEEFYITGYFENTIDFDPTSDVFNLTGMGTTKEAHVVKLFQCDNSTATETVEACKSYTWPITGQTYISTGTYNGSIPNVAGCDSIITLDLTINSINTGVTLTDVITLQALQNGATYQWLDCDDNYAVIAGETNQEYITNANGNYAVEVTFNNCTDTSDCYTIDHVGLIENTITDQIQLYPNPSHGQFTLNFDNVEDQVQVRILTPDGKIIYDNQTTKKQLEFDLNIPEGTYFIEILANQKRTLLKLIITD